MANASGFEHIALSLIIPVYNEEDAVRHAIEANIVALQALLKDYEVIIINDGSADRSAAIIDETAGGRAFIRVLHKPKNEGMGGAVMSGIQLATKTYVLPVPVDCPLDTDILKKFISNLDHYDMVIGYRPVRVGYSLRMKLNSFVFHQLVSRLFRVQLKDYNWIHLYKRKIFTEDGIVITSKGIPMLAEVLIKGIRKGLRIKEIEVEQKERLTGVATASKISTVLKTIREIFVLYAKIG